jgi:butyryl-CoA dehydrogenase
MAYRLTDDQRMMRDVAEKFARTELLPLANQIDRDERTPPELTKRCADLGFLGLYIPEAYGGLGADVTTACIVLEELAKASPAFAGLLSVEMVLCPGVVDLIGAEEQKQRLLPPSARGERVMAYSQTEPAGSGYITQHQTRLTAEGNAYRLSGHKLFCTQGEAMTYLVMCRTQRDGQDGYGCVIVEGDAPGFKVEKYEDKLGWRGTNTGPISFTDMEIKPEDVLGDLLTANADIYPVNQASFVCHSATSLGAAQGLFDLTLQYVKDRPMHGKPMYHLSPISDRLASVYTKLEACRALLYSSAEELSAGRFDKPYGSICKTYICDLAFEMTSQLLQMWGGSGMMNSTGVNRYMRDARTNMIAEGSTEAHHYGIARRYLGMTF